MTEFILILATTLVTSFVTQKYVVMGRLSDANLFNPDFFKSTFNSVLITIIKTFRYINRVYIASSKESKDYQIKHVFLIDRESGIQVEEVSFKDDGILNGDVISAMFSAIQSFVHDAFSRDHSSRLTDFRVGDHSIWVAHGPKLMLACVMVGDVPKALKSELDHTLQLIQSEFITSLSDLGQYESIEGVVKVMNELMLAQKSMSLA
jgi:hypothetical protein